jgi:hypothetical protein
MQCGRHEDADEADETEEAKEKRMLILVGFSDQNPTQLSLHPLYWIR